MSDRFVKLRAELTTARGWIRTLIDVAENDTDATQNWYIPALTLDYEGYVMEPFWDGINNMDLSSERDNESKNKYFQSYANTIIDSLTRRIAATREGVSYEVYMENE